MSSGWFYRALLSGENVFWVIARALLRCSGWLPVSGHMLFHPSQLFALVWFRFCVRVLAVHLHNNIILGT